MGGGLLAGIPPSDDEPVDGLGGRGDDTLGGGDVERTLEREAAILELGEPGGEDGNGAVCGAVSCFFDSVAT